MSEINASNIMINSLVKTKPDIKMFFRCTSLLFAERFLKTGNIRFGIPQEWIDDYKANGDGRGDLLEGCYCCMPNFNLAVANFYKSLRPNSETFRDSRNNYLYFRSRDVLTMRTFCLYGLDKNDFRVTTMGEDRKNHPTYAIPKKYFEDFSGVSVDVYDELPPETKPVLIMIHNPSEFCKRLRLFMENWGLRDDEWIIHPIGYSGKNKNYLVGDGIPSELFLKDSSFEYQKEVRVVVCTERKVILNKFNRCNGIVDLGCMEDIADIQEYYFGDMTMQLRGTNSLVYTLPRPIVKPLEELPPESLMAMIQQAYENRIIGEDLSDEFKRNEYIKVIVDTLDKFFDIEFNYFEASFRKRGTNTWVKVKLQSEE